MTTFACGPCISASIAAPLLIPSGSWYLPGRSLPRRIVTVALASNSRAESITPADSRISPMRPASEPLGTVTLTAPLGSSWNGWKVALIRYSAPAIRASASTARMRRPPRPRGAPAGRWGLERGGGGAPGPARLRAVGPARGQRPRARGGDRAARERPRLLLVPLGAELLRGLRAGHRLVGAEGVVGHLELALLDLAPLGLESVLEPGAVRAVGLGLGRDRLGLRRGRLRRRLGALDAEVLRRRPAPVERPGDPRRSPGVERSHRGGRRARRRPGRVPRDCAQGLSSVDAARTASSL